MSRWLLLIVHLAGTWLSKGHGPRGKTAAGKRRTRTRCRSRHAPLLRYRAQCPPTLVVLLGILLLGAGLFFVDGAFSALMRAFMRFCPICPGFAAVWAACWQSVFLAHAIMVYRQRKMEQEYAWRREVLDKTGIVLLDRKSLAISGNDGKIAPLEALDQNNRVLDVTSQALPPSDNQQSPDDEKPKV